MPDNATTHNVNLIIVLSLNLHIFWQEIRRNSTDQAPKIMPIICGKACNRYHSEQMAVYGLDSKVTIRRSGSFLAVKSRVRTTKVSAVSEPTSKSEFETGGGLAPMLL